MLVGFIIDANASSSFRAHTDGTFFSARRRRLNDTGGSNVYFFFFVGVYIYIYNTKDYRSRRTVASLERPRRGSRLARRSLACG